MADRSHPEGFKEQWLGVWVVPDRWGYESLTVGDEHIEWPQLIGYSHGYWMKVLCGLEQAIKSLFTSRLLRAFAVLLDQRSSDMKTTFVCFNLFFLSLMFFLVLVRSHFVFENIISVICKISFFLLLLFCISFVWFYNVFWYKLYLFCLVQVFVFYKLPWKTCFHFVLHFVFISIIRLWWSSFFAMLAIQIFFILQQKATLT